jgi:hypothetical protein
MTSETWRLWLGACSSDMTVKIVILSGIYLLLAPGTRPTFTSFCLDQVQAAYGIVISANHLAACPVEVLGGEVDAVRLGLLKKADFRMIG